MALSLNFLASFFRDLFGVWGRVWGNKKRYETPTSTAVGPLITNCSIGIPACIQYDAAKVSHQVRSRQEWPDGVTRVGPVWSHIISKGAGVESEAKAKTCLIVSSEFSRKKATKKVQVPLFFHNSIPVGETFIKNPEGKLDPDVEQSCTLQANMSGLAEDVNLKDGPAGQYFVVKFEVVVKGDGTKLKAFMQWDEKGVTKRGPATVIPVELVPDYQTSAASG